MHATLAGGGVVPNLRVEHDPTASNQANPLLQQPGSLVDAEGDVHVLHGSTRGALA